MPIIKPATVSPGAPQQHKQPSRKGKKAWRKNVDVTDIQEGLEEVREELIKGGVIVEKDSADLFTLDLAGDAAIPKKYLRGSKPLKADEIIAQRSAVSPVSQKKRAGDKTSDGVIQPKRQRTSYLSHKELSRLRNVADGRPSEALVEVIEASYDPWDAQKDIEEATQDPRFSFLEKSKKKVAPTTLKHKPISLAASGKDIPAVKKPEGGYSYNPVFTDYEERLVIEGEKELAAEQKRLDAAKAERVKLDATAKSAAEAEAAEAKADLSEWDDDSAWEGFDSGAEDVKLNAKRPERKTQAQRNRIKRRKEEERKAKMAADIKKKNEQAALAKKIAKELSEKEKSRRSAIVNEVESSSEGDDLELRRRKLGKMSLPEKDLELVLPDELQESLRLLKPEGNLLKDRYRNLLVRGKVESRRPISFAKKPKRKATEKWTHKDFMLH
ncbi:putative 60S ribosomal biogenesis protein Nop53 [Hyaloscypha variabilis F]|uniref:Ribosome biogenesis protein NOP53 n=1 Tax=Hyaloscypha variabilis (strain UAMH 11265 / GT02V1 / F) TaxID=1149755 RepID=A0A2J6RBK7_HYAVF|nr:putative 60S ribosomal biogenesis protein Nop53 [Hyaloscypha variabilis F]